MSEPTASSLTTGILMERIISSRVPGTEAVRSATVSTITGSAFTSACTPTMTPVNKAGRCLYYLDKNKVYQLCFPSRTKKLLFSLEQEKAPSEKNDLWSFKAGAGHLIWKAGMLYVWDGTRIYAIDEADSVSSYLISPDGRCISWNEDRRADGTTGYTEEVLEAEFENKENKVFVSAIGSKDYKEVYSQTYTVEGVGADHSEAKKLVVWSAVNPFKIFVNTKFEEQLFGGDRGLKVIDFRTGEEKNVGRVIEQVLAISPDETKIAYTPNDETCCSGSNYTNNTVIIDDLVTDRRTTIYDEWKEFGNEGKEDEHMPDTAAFSPDGRAVAISITGNKIFTTIRKSDGSGTLLDIADRFVVGWIGQNTLILGKREKSGHSQRQKVEDIYVYDLKGRKEESLELRDITYLAFE